MYHKDELNDTLRYFKLFRFKTKLTGNINVECKGICRKTSSFLNDIN